jgi:hypothetical protein
LLVVGILTVVLSPGALGASVVTADKFVERVAADLPPARSRVVQDIPLDAGPDACHCPRLTTKRGHELSHPAEQADGPTVISAGDGDRRRDLIIMSAMVGRRHAATALTLQPYQLSVSPNVTSAGVAMPAYRQ